MERTQDVSLVLFADTQNTSNVLQTDAHEAGTSVTIHQPVSVDRVLRRDTVNCSRRLLPLCLNLSVIFTFIGRGKDGQMTSRGSESIQMELTSRLRSSTDNDLPAPVLAPLMFRKSLLLLSILKRCSQQASRLQTLFVMQNLDGVIPPSDESNRIICCRRYILSSFA